MTAENRELSLLRDRIAELERELARLRVDPLAPSPKPVHADPESPSPRLAIDRRLSREQELARITRITTLGEMTAGLAHDLNQPLSSIQSLAFACQQRLSGERSGDEALSENLEEIRNQADRARRIIQRVRLFIRNAAPRRVENPINQLVDEAIRLSESDPALEGITVEAALDLAGPVVVVDGTLIEQVILNLMRNAGEALQTSDIPERRVVLETRYVPGRGVEVAVSDNGPGMPPGVARDAFQPFFSTKEEGLGMGLTICRSIIEAHGGTITAESNPSGGTTFRFVVPAS